VSDDGIPRGNFRFHKGVIQMLVLRRKTGERIQIGSEIQLTVLDIRNGRVKLGFSGPRDVEICREELLRRDAPVHADSPAERWVEWSSHSAT
jgi:carbon storage regulator